MSSQPQDLFLCLVVLGLVAADAEVKEHSGRRSSSGITISITKETGRFMLMLVVDDDVDTSKRGE
jgi:hypothetical protein